MAVRPCTRFYEQEGLTAGDKVGLGSRQKSAPTREIPTRQTTARSRAPAEMIAYQPRPGEFGAPVAIHEGAAAWDLEQRGC